MKSETMFTCRHCGKLFPKRHGGKNAFCSLRCCNIWQKVPFESRFVRVDEKSCWNWVGSKNKDGYGLYHYGGKTLAHQVAWLKHKGEIPKALCVCHSCDNPACVNPDHLFIGTKADNTKDMIRKGRDRHPKGEDHFNSKLTELDILRMRDLFRSGMDAQKISDQFGICESTANRIVAYKAWVHVP